MPQDTPSAAEPMAPEASATIYVVRPPDPAQDLVAFELEDDALRYGATIDALGHDDIETLTVTGTRAAGQLIRARRREQYEDLVLPAGYEPDEPLADEDLRQHVLTMSLADNYKTALHLTDDEVDAVLDAASDAVLAGWSPCHLYDLNTGETRSVSAKARVTAD